MCISMASHSVVLYFMQKLPFPSLVYCIGESMVWVMLILMMTQCIIIITIIMAATFDFTTFLPSRSHPFNIAWLFLHGISISYQFW